MNQSDLILILIERLLEDRDKINQLESEENKRENDNVWMYIKSLKRKAGASAFLFCVLNTLGVYESIWVFSINI